jgi:long-chain acyl-CoA synthetase
MSGAGAPPPWWRESGALRRYVGDLLADELARLRRGHAALPPCPWPGDLALDRDLGVDSLELMQLGAALAEAIHLHESGIEDELLAKRTLADWTGAARTGLDRFSGALTFRTSGSSGIPKPCIHSLATLCEEAGELAILFAGRRRIFSAVPSHHIYGFLFTILLPRMIGIPAAEVIDLRRGSPARLAGCLRAGDLVIGHPEFWQAAGRAVPQVPADVYGVTSTAPCADHVSDAVERAGFAKLFHVYGSSEAAGIGWRSSHREPYRLFRYWSFAAEAPHTLVRTLPDGAQRMVPSQDILEQRGADTFLVGRRHDDAVQVGGINVFPQHVGNVLKRHPKVHDAAVRLMRPEEGNRLKAYVVPAPDVRDAGALLAELNAWIDSVLPAPERPKSITFGAALPRSATGKLCDWIASPP